MAPEALRGNPYTKAADIYSFGIICIRPEIIKGIIPEYIELMKRCWNNDPKKRPTANELSNIFLNWSIKYPIEEDKEKRIPIPGTNFN
ncbi:hypothetical protein C1646_698195 [Rhizophagus diaphanus]|nr:hypothetical protein C1646_698195 [Rhizophagus diaphanus] [Rhizophagus sp. MUCL 43196]